MMPRMQLSRRGELSIKGWEKCRLTAYPDSRGIWTIGWGHTGPEVREGLTWTQMQADVAFLRDSEWAVKAVNDMVMVPLTQAQFDALVSLVYNIGAPAFFGSTLLKHLNRGEYLDARNQFLVWNKETVNGKKRTSKGLVARRGAEARMFDGEDAG